MGYDRLEPMDAYFLHAESDRTPQHTGGVLVIDGGPLLDDAGHFRLEDMRRRIGSRLHLVPRMRKRLMFVPLEQGRPIWVDDERFDITFHVRHTALPKPGSAEQLQALVGRVQAQQLDRRRALWELWFVEGLVGGQVAMIMKTHHCMVDGVSSVDLLTALVDLSPDVGDAPAPPWDPEPPPSRPQLLSHSIRERATEPAEILRSVRAGLRAPASALRRGSQVVGLVSKAQSPGDPTPWNVDVSPHRYWLPLQVPLAEVKAIKQGTEATVNDVILAACAGAIRAFLIERGEFVDHRVLRASVPISVRSESEKGSFGNRVSGVIVDLPVSEARPLDRLAVAHESMREVKESGIALTVQMITDVQRYIPPTLLSLASRQVGRGGAINANITNIPGPQFPLYCLGAEVLEIYPYTGLIDGLALSIAVMSYNGSMSFGVTTCPEVLPDFASFMGHLAQEFVILKNAS